MSWAYCAPKSTTRTKWGSVLGRVTKEPFGRVRRRVRSLDVSRPPPASSVWKRIRARPGREGGRALIVHATAGQCLDMEPDVGGSKTVGPTHHNEPRSEEHTSELQSLMRISYAVFCLKKKK